MSTKQSTAGSHTSLTFKDWDTLIQNARSMPGYPHKEQFALRIQAAKGRFESASSAQEAKAAEEEYTEFSNDIKGSQSIFEFTESFPRLTDEEMAKMKAVATELTQALGGTTKGSGSGSAKKSQGGKK